MSSKKHNLERGSIGAAGACVLVLSLVVSAFFMTVAAGSPTYWWLGWVTLLPLFQAIRVLSPWRAAASGALWGVSLFAFCVSSARSDVSASLSSFILLAAIPSAYTYVGARLTSQVGFSPYLLALGWMGVELALRPLGMRHGLLASSIGDGVAIRALGSFAGYVVVAFLVAYVNAALLTVLSGVCRTGSSSRLIRYAGSAAQRIFITENFAVPCHLIRPAQPRAPPVSI